jgi:putative transposase
MLSQHYPVRQVCRVLHYARSRYYHQPRSRDEAPLKAAIARLAEAWPIYGDRRITALLHREQVQVNHKYVARLMREMGLQARRGRRRPARTTDSRHDLPVAPNLLDRHFAAERPDTVWLADISYLPTDEGFLYLAAIEDLATREIPPVPLRGPEDRLWLVDGGSPEGRPLHQRPGHGSAAPAAGARADPPQRPRGAG